ncbi:hypothetical protein ACOSP7_016922 [Xanthoceras sorbifolium]
MKKINSSLLAKASWRLLQQNGSLWCNMLGSKYLRRRNLFDFIADKRSSSYVWKYIVHGIKCILDGLIRRFGDSRNIGFWTDNWVPKVGVLQPYVLKVLDQTQLNRKVCDFIEENDWDFNQLCKDLPLNIVKCIISIHAGQPDSGEDKIIWGHSNDENFSIK